MGDLWDRRGDSREILHGNIQEEHKENAGRTRGKNKKNAGRTQDVRRKIGSYYGEMCKIIW
jgi:hypothetical protein